MKCPRCKSKSATIVKQYDNEELKHNHMKCNDCEYEFNHWNEPEAKLRETFGQNYDKYQ